MIDRQIASPNSYPAVFRGVERLESALAIPRIGTKTLPQPNIASNALTSLPAQGATTRRSKDP